MNKYAVSLSCLLVFSLNATVRGQTASMLSKTSVSSETAFEDVTPLAVKVMRPARAQSVASPVQGDSFKMTKPTVAMRLPSVEEQPIPKRAAPRVRLNKVAPSPSSQSRVLANKSAAKPTAAKRLPSVEAKRIPKRAAPKVRLTKVVPTPPQPLRVLPKTPSAKSALRQPLTAQLPPVQMPRKEVVVPVSATPGLAQAQMTQSSSGTPRMPRPAAIQVPKPVSVLRSTEARTRTPKSVARLPVAAHPVATPHVAAGPKQTHQTDMRTQSKDLISEKIARRQNIPQAAVRAPSMPRPPRQKVTPTAPKSFVASSIRSSQPVSVQPVATQPTVSAPPKNAIEPQFTAPRASLAGDMLVRNYQDDDAALLDDLKKVAESGDEGLGAANVTKDEGAKKGDAGDTDKVKPKLILPDGVSIDDLEMQDGEIVYNPTFDETAGGVPCNSGQCGTCSNCCDVQVNPLLRHIGGGLRNRLVGDCGCKQPYTEAGIGHEWLALAPFAIQRAQPLNHVGFRFAAAYDHTFPDRSEFFWSKIGGGGPSQRERSVDYQDFRFQFEMGGERFSAQTDIPIRVIDPVINSNTAGLGDIGLTTRTVLFDGEAWQVTQVLNTQFNTGSALRGRGNGHISIEPGLLARWEYSDFTHIHGEVKYMFPVGGIDPDHSGELLRYGLGFSHLTYDSDSFGLITTLELVGGTFLDGEQTPAGAGDPTDVDGIGFLSIHPGARFIFDSPGDWGTWDMGIGGGFAVTGSRMYDSILMFDIRWAF